MTSFPHLLAALCRQVWALEESRVYDLFAVVERRVHFGKLTKEEIDAIKGPRDPAFPNGSVSLFAIMGAGDVSAVEARGPSGGPAAPGSLIAVINVFGIVAQHAAQVDDISGPGGTSTERVAASFRTALADPSVKAIVLNVNSPGGSVSGVEALAEEIYRARGKKPIVAQCNSLMASAAYWIGAAADEIVMTPGAQAGSIGVYAMHEDKSAKMERDGVKVTFISAGKYKVEGNPYEPLQDEAAQAQQKTVNSYYSDFTRFVAKARGVKVDDVRNGFGQGRIEKDHDAVKAGMADGVDTLDGTLRRLAGTKSSVGARAAAADAVPHVAIGPDHPAFRGGCPTMHIRDGRVFVESMWPVQTTAVREFIDDECLALGGRNVVDANGEKTLIFTAENGSAHYRVTGFDPDRGVYALVLSEGWTFQPMPSEAPPEPAGMSAADRDAFRRRRHAHRMRSK